MLGEVRFVQTTLLGRLRRWQLRGVDRWVALTPAMRDEILELGVAPEKIAIIPNSASLPESPACAAEVRADARSRLGLNYPHIGVFAGRLSQEKRLDLLLHAWRRVVDQFPGAHLLLLGQGGAYRNAEPELRLLQRELQLEEHVHFLGHVSNVCHYLLACDVFCLPSVSEGMSNSLVEAMAAGTAIVTTSIPANDDLLEHQRNALLVPPGDGSALADAIIHVLSSPILRDRLGQAVRDAAERSLTVERMGQRYLGLYRDLYANRQRR
jgi:glycosyltransferase involved in cell wall biosynthesis